MKRPMNKWKWIGLYGGLLLISQLWEWTHPDNPELVLEGSVIMVEGLEGDPAQVRVGLRDIPAAEPSAPVLVLLHGSPVASTALNPLIESLRGAYRLIVPDLPGFGMSANSGLANYSVERHAAYLIKILDTLNIREAHLVGYSMGGGVALSFIQKAPERVQSFTMLSSIGVFEYELFGRHELNHAVHGAQWAFLRAIDLLVPHFGYFNKQPLNLAYARNFYDTDQREFRALLSKYTGPVLIQHGRSDGLVPIEAAYEHERIIPQSTLIEYGGGHLLVMKDPILVTRDLKHFIEQVEAGEGVSRAESDTDRLAAAHAPFVRDRNWHYTGMTVVVIFLLLAIATLVTEDLTCISAGFLVANGLMTFPVAAGACMLGIFVGDGLLYVLGRRLGRAGLRRAPIKWFVSETAEKSAERWFEQRGALIILITRFIPGTRTATYFTAGVLRAPVWKFIFWFGIAAAIWTPLLVGISAQLGERIFTYYAQYEAWGLWIGLGLGAALYVMIKVGLPLFSWKGRRLLLGQWKRLVGWEFWPMWAVNGPVLLYTVGLSVFKYRKLMLATVTNPGIAQSGFIGESKSAILQALSGAGDSIARWDLIEKGTTREERRRLIKEFQDSETTAWPIVLKPDEGQRGARVIIAKKALDVELVLNDVETSWIMQSYVAGVEYGVFYYRKPSEERGRIISITHKVMTLVIGDGVSNLEHLILKDARTVCLGARFLEMHRDRLAIVPGKGERVELVELGTHARGSLFLDEGDLLTEALTDAVDTIAKAFEGFYFGRFDLRVSDVASFQQGVGLKVLELNGITSESTHMYDPKHGAIYGWKTLFRQWSIALEIAKENWERGHAPSRFVDFMRELRAGFQRAKD